MLTAAELAKLKEFDAPTVANAIEAFGIRPNTAGFMAPGMLQRTCFGEPMVGYAATAKVSASSPGTAENEETLLSYYEAVGAMPGPVIAVIKDVDEAPVGSFWGEVQSTVHKSLGAVGTLTDGGVRDLDAVEEMGFCFFSTCLLVSHAYIHMESFGEPLDILGLTVRPGDLLFCDVHGVVQIPEEIAPKLADMCRVVAEAEYPVLNPARAAIAAGRTPSKEELRAWRKEMSRQRKEHAAKLK
ncbi:RraA family protein [Oscillospiraceae bacterium OttesenSCG-928-G22]|nr:RraA family protein [Oscillospiraceae bacterium OttesenSCG-928-G22]